MHQDTAERQPEAANEAAYAGFTDLRGRYVPFEATDEVFARARMLGARILLRLALDEGDDLHGVLYTDGSVRVRLRG